jgi:hypothetical protein
MFVLENRYIIIVFNILVEKLGRKLNLICGKNGEPAAMARRLNRKTLE